MENLELLENILETWSEKPVSDRVSIPHSEKTMAVLSGLYENLNGFINKNYIATCFYRDDSDFEKLLDQLTAANFHFLTNYGGFADVWKVYELHFSTSLEME